MLFDEKDLRVFDNSDSGSYFKEILQLFYSQNYRASIVLLGTLKTGKILI